MIMACGAETRIAKKYAKFVEESREHAQFTGPLIAIQFGSIVCRRLQSILVLIFFFNIFSSSLAFLVPLVLSFGMAQRSLLREEYMTWALLSCKSNRRASFIMPLTIKVSCSLS